MKSAKLIGKVLIGFLLTGAALSVAILFMYRSIHDVSTAVDEAGKPNERQEEWKTTVNLLYEAENRARNLRVLKNGHESISEHELNAFDSIRTEQTIHLSRLYDLNEDSLQGLILCDSIRVLSAERFEVLADWIRFASIENNENSVLNAILVEMAKREKKVSEENVQRTESVSAEDQNTRVVATDKEKSFWQRLVKKKKSTYEPVAVVAFDSTRQIDSLVPVVGTKELRKTIQSGQIRIETKADSLLREESRLLKADQQIMSRIHAVSDQYEKLCGKETSAKLKAVSEAASVGTKSVTMWTIGAALCIILFSVFFIGRDIVRNRRFQAQLQVAKENAERFAKTKEDFMANMSHEIRNPLNVISGFSRQLAKEELSEKNKKQAEGIHRSSEFLIALVNDILDISKVKSGKLQLEKIPFPLQDIRDDLENAFGTQAKEKGLRFTVEIAKELPPAIIGDPVRFRQILFNIVSNAVKFTDKGFITVTFEQVTHTDGTKKLQLRVADSGIGIAEEKINTIFEEFEQADATITRKYGGTGLGLSITRVLVSEMNGAIVTKSEPGKGTTFTIILPLETFSNGIAKSNKENFDAAHLNGKKILICDDDPMNRLITTQLIKNYQAEIIEACSGKDALELLAKEKIDLVLIDLEMPEMSGEETIAFIRKMDEKNKTLTKIIAVTGRNKENFSNGRSIAADGYVQKPFGENEMLSEITRVLGLQPQIAQL